MIVRTWRGAVRAEDADAYLEYLRLTGLADYAGSPGHVATLGLRRTSGATTEYLLLTAWDSPEAIRGFAGDDPDRAVFYPEDERYLVSADDRAGHFEPFYVAGDGLLGLQPDASPARGNGAGPRHAARLTTANSDPGAARRGWWWRGWVAYAAGMAGSRGTGADFR